MGFENDVVIAKSYNRDFIFNRGNGTIETTILVEIKDRCLVDYMTQAIIRHGNDAGPLVLSPNEAKKLGNILLEWAKDAEAAIKEGVKRKELGE